MAIKRETLEAEDEKRMSLPQFQFHTLHSDLNIILLSHCPIVIATMFPSIWLQMDDTKDKHDPFAISDKGTPCTSAFYAALIQDYMP
ncbi:uncharacterized protein G2W53_000409 [Senna tora]|uniref:Uncharacterized protein n=1 Tax=Senna tora TaxID=362788 RepID=A0A834XDV0_9FABA|nr:uncharacterized protein G2W53_000409 [Senna tora]